MATATRSLRDVLAAGVRTVRQQQGLRQEEAAARLRAHGLTSWLRGTVAQAETGSRRLSLEDLLLVALAYEVTPAELLTGADDEWVELAPEARLTLGAVRALLSGDRESVAHRDRQAVDVAATRPTTGPVRSSRFNQAMAA